MYYFGSIGSICNHWSDLIALQATTEVMVSDVRDKTLFECKSKLTMVHMKEYIWLLLSCLTKTCTWLWADVQSASPQDSSD